jgi:hypothetical protein
MRLPRFRVRTLMLAVGVVAVVITADLWVLDSHRDNDGDIPKEVDVAMVIIMDVCIATVVVTAALAASIALQPARRRSVRAAPMRRPCDSADSQLEG